jgi:hypothetical protein
MVCRRWTGVDARAAVCIDLVVKKQYQAVVLRL